VNPLGCPAHRKLRCAYAINPAAPALDELGPELLPDEPRHFGGDNYAFADGAFRWIPRKRSQDGEWTKEPAADWAIWELVVEESSHPE
jgi:hypothetical protein